MCGRLLRESAEDKDVKDGDALLCSDNFYVERCEEKLEMGLSERSTVDITVAIYYHNSFPLLLDCMKTVLCQSSVNLELLVFDNSSCDFDREKFDRAVNEQGGADRTVYIKSDTYLFGAEVYRRIIEASKGEYLLFLQQEDRVVNDVNCLRHLLGFAHAEGADAVAARTSVDGEDEEVVLMPPQPFWDDAKDMGSDELYEWFLISGDTPFLCFSSLLIKRERLSECSLLNECRYNAKWSVIQELLSSGSKVCFFDKCIAKSPDSEQKVDILKTTIYRRVMNERARLLEERCLTGDNCGLFMRLRVKLSAFRIRALVVNKTQWFFMSKTERAAWKLKNFKLLLLQDLMNWREKGFKPNSYDRITFLFVVLLLIEMSPWSGIKRLLTAIFGVVLLFSVLPYLVSLAVFCARKLLNLRLKKKEKPQGD